MWEHICMSACGLQRTIFSVISQESPIFLETGLLLAWSSGSRLGLLASEPQGHGRLYPPQPCTLDFPHGFLGLTSGPLSYTVGP